MIERPSRDGNQVKLEHRRGPSALAGVVTAVTVGCAVGVAVSVFGTWRVGSMFGWMAAAAVFLTRLWWAVWPMDGETTQRYARREDPRQGLSDAVMLFAAVFSLGAVGLLLTGTGGSKDAQAALSVCSVALAWGVVHSVFAIRYARIYYDEEAGSVDFNQTGMPRYSDFAYLAFTVGMTFQVSDTVLRSWCMRRAVLRHALLAYVFGAVIIATLINLVGGLGG